jgi:PAS domain S-box-containing protein
MLQEARAHAALAARFHDTGDARVTVDPDFRIIGWDADAERLFGCTAQKAIGRLSWDVITFHGDRMARIRALRGGGWKGDLVLAAKSGDHVAIQTHVAPFRNTAGRIILWQATHRRLPESLRPL